MRCNVCECEAFTLYDNQPMCFLCRDSAAKAKADAAETKCNVCVESPADTFYMNQPMCYGCRSNVAAESWAIDNARDAAAARSCNLCNGERACGECAEDLYVEGQEYNDSPSYPEDKGQLDNDDVYQSYEDHMTDAEADADTLASCGWGTDEDYGYYGDD